MEGRQEGWIPCPPRRRQRGGQRLMPKSVGYLYKKRDSTNWWIKLQYPASTGRPMVRKSLGTADRIEAEIIALPMIQQHKRDLYFLRQNVTRKLQVGAVRTRYPLGDSTLADGTKVFATQMTAVLIRDGVLVAQEDNFLLDLTDVTRTFDPEEAAKPKPEPVDNDLALLDEYLRFKGHDPESAYAAEARSTWAEFKAFTGGKLIKDCDRTNGRAYVAFLRGKDLKTATVVKRVNFLAAPINHANETGDLKGNPFFKVVDHKDDKLERLCFDADDMALANAHMLPKLGKDERLMWLILAATGMRHSEAFAIREEFREDGIRYVRVGKKTDSSKRRVPLPDCLLPHLPAKITGPLFEDPNLKNISKNLLRAVRRGVTKDKRKVVYSLRHRVHTRLREIGCPQDIQKEIVGHKNGDHGNYGTFALRTLKPWIDQIGLA
ncbi:putative integrase [Methylorubrum extorquens DM4]|uniref:Integrase n=2 Tax=Methylorubrum extorquens TaxID=408 RepID=C7C7C0_METED|nr:putative integrase [Methylorubrum extorquens DM4]